MKLVLFDVDGTLVESAALIHEVMARTFVEYGYSKPDVSQTKSIIGLTLDIAITRMLHQEVVSDQIRDMAEHYKNIFIGVRQEMGFQETLFPGIIEMIAEFAKRDDILMGAVTGKGRRGLNLVMDTHGLRKHFIVSRTADDCPSKPSPSMVLECCHDTGVSPKDTYVVGDAIYDMQMAKSAGANSIAVSWGYASREELVRAGANYVVDKPREIPLLVPMN